MHYNVVLNVTSMVFRGVLKNVIPLCDSPPPMWWLKILSSTSLLLQVSLINMTTVTRPHTQFPPTPGPARKASLPGCSLASQTEVTPHPYFDTPINLLKCAFLKNLTHNWWNLQEPYNQGIQVQVSTKDNKKEGRLCMNSLPP